MRVVFFDLARLALNISYVILGKRKVVLRDRGAVQWTGAKEKSARSKAYSVNLLMGQSV